jgi:adenine-specific DNA-methyltransferase
VDINPNSVKICRLRLWIELLKNAYYKNESELETLPNIDINIKNGNSLINRFALDADLKQIAKSSKWNIFSYQNAVEAYKRSPNKDIKQDLERLIKSIKSNYIETIQKRNPKLQKYYRLKQEYDYKFPENGLFANEPDETYGGDAGKIEKENKN